MGTTLDDAMVAAALGDLDEALTELPPATVSALRLADLLTGDSPSVDQEFYAELRHHFGHDQILELGSALAVASGWQRFIEAFGIRPDSPWVEQFQAR
jgi:alkylhydroperoxidase family enzyme